jgi:hypothetical protein
MIEEVLTILMVGELICRILLAQALGTPMSFSS